MAAKTEEYRTMDTDELAPYPGMTSDDLREFEAWAEGKDLRLGFWPETSRGKAKTVLLALAGGALAIGILLGISTTAQGAERDPLVLMVLQEASGESFVGQVAVAAVALARVKDRRWPNTEREVVYQPAQFKGMSVRTRWYNAREIQKAEAAVTRARAGWRPCGEDIFWYYAAWSRPPYWAKSYKLKCVIGDHLFFVD